jgi:hypothetical protein
MIPVVDHRINCSGNRVMASAVFDIDCDPNALTPSVRNFPQNKGFAKSAVLFRGRNRTNTLTVASFAMGD